MQAATPAFRAVVEELTDLDAGSDQVVRVASMSVRSGMRWPNREPPT
jgi:hypothetical protein